MLSRKLRKEKLTNINENKIKSYVEKYEKYRLCRLFSFLHARNIIAPVIMHNI